MNNEEKILSLLEKLSEDVKDVKVELSTVKEDVKDLKEDVKGLQEELTVVKEDIKGLKYEVRKINIRIENEIMPGIQILKEGYQGLNEKFDNMTKRNDGLEEDIITLKVLHPSKSFAFK